MIGGIKASKARVRQAFQDQLNRKVFALREAEWERFERMPGMSRRDKLLYLIATAEAVQAITKDVRGLS